MILVIDDDDDIADAIALALEYAGHDVQVAPSAEKGLALAASRTPELVLLDWQIPEVSGLEILDRLDSLPHLKSVPVILMSGDLKKIPGEMLKVRPHLAKPFDLQTLTELVGRLIQTKAM